MAIKLCGLGAPTPIQLAGQRGRANALVVLTSLPAVPVAPRQGASCVARSARNGARCVRGGGSGLNLATPR